MLKGLKQSKLFEDLIISNLGNFKVGDVVKCIREIKFHEVNKEGYSLVIVGFIHNQDIAKLRRVRKDNYKVDRYFCAYLNIDNIEKLGEIYK